MAEPKKIAVLRANALGDFIFVLPALQALEDTYPSAEIVLLGKAWHKEFLRSRPGPVDRVEVIPFYPGVGEDAGPSVPVDEEKIETFFSRMRRERFDVAFQLHGGGRYSNRFVKRLGAKLSVGLKTPDAPELDINIPYIYYQNEFLRYLEVVAKIGARTFRLAPEVMVIERDMVEAQKVLKGFGSSPIAVIHPGATDLRRRWPAENFSQVALALSARGARVVVTGTAAEAWLVAKVISGAQGHAQDLCGKLSLSGLAGLIKAAAVVVANDTGPLHLAEAVGTASVGIYWCGNVINGGPITRSLHRPLLSWTVACPLCGADCAKEAAFSRSPGLCQHEIPFVSGVSVAEVTEASLELLEARGQLSLKRIYDAGLYDAGQSKEIGTTEEDRSP